MYLVRTSAARFIGHGRVLLIKGLHVDTLSEYSDYKKFSIATDSAVKPEPPH